ncbi:Lcl C-terminal domain-containing protein [Flammeovirga sp. MY04]|uniref:Lcl C-terminal domain-containing protein n=1 Tax=Flammeovirga sp. MY04 TaxID=1191459 RepID=UPI00080618EF|nr:DUF1566 domain-containing protein [Flammeovirga sp. MY04]
MIKRYIILLNAFLILFIGTSYTLNRGSKNNLKYPIVGTNQTKSFDNKKEIDLPKLGDKFYGQNANHLGNSPQYQDNNDGTITDLVTGLMWQKSLDHNGDGKIDVNDKLSYKDIIKEVNKANTGGYNDWRLPTIKELYSLIMFDGQDLNPQANNSGNIKPFINTDYFDFAYGDASAGERLIDVQCATSTIHEGELTLIYGVNFADGRIKGYGQKLHGKAKKFNYFLVRGNEEYGENDFKDNNNGTITDENTGLMWQKNDAGEGMTWEEALEYAEESDLGGYSDWRLPDAKELQSIVDYERANHSSGAPAIHPIFDITPIKNEKNENDYAFFWSSTTHERQGKNGGGAAVYFAFGKSLGNMPKRPEGRGPNGKNRTMGPPPRKENNQTSNLPANWIDIHGPGSQRSDPKSGNPSKFKDGKGPQGDAVRIYNSVRLVRNI